MSGTAEKSQGTIVVIEDDADIRALITTVLTRAGYDVHTAATAREGIALATRLVPDLITLDVGLPDSDGFAVTRFLRDVTSTKNVPVLMLTARVQDHDRSHARAIGVDAYLSKPFRPRGLRELVAALLDTAAVRRRHVPAGSPSASGHAFDLTTQTCIISR
jgi:two-component system, OmpR family, response regulator